MKEVQEHAPGTFCWVELGTTNSEAAKRFYNSLFGWSIEDLPDSSGMVYTLLQVEKSDIAALYQMSAEQQSQGISPNWLSYVSVKSADEAAARAKELGGKVMMGPADVPGAGRLAVMSDPQGALFAVWQPGHHIGARIVNEPRTLCWNELVTFDEQAAIEFYTSLFGWKAQALPMESMSYTVFQNGERPAGGCMKITPSMGPVPPHWLVYFAVEGCDEMVEKAKSAGGTVLVQPTDIPRIGRFSVLQDPQGAAFAVIRLSQS